MKKRPARMKLTRFMENEMIKLGWIKGNAENGATGWFMRGRTDGQGGDYWIVCVNRIKQKHPPQNYTYGIDGVKRRRTQVRVFNRDYAPQIFQHRR